MNSVWTIAGAWAMLEAKAKEVQTPLRPVMEQSYPPPLAAVRVGNSPLTEKLLAVMGGRGVRWNKYILNTYYVLNCVLTLSYLITGD